MSPFPQLFEFLSDMIGLNPESVGSDSLAGAIKTRMRAAHVVDESGYLKLLRSSHDELRMLLEAVTVPETWFFRDRGAFEKLRSFAAQSVIRNPARCLRVLSIPCASGEEPYSIAMTLLEAGVPRSNFQIDGVDIRENAIARAEAGHYSRNSFRGDELSFRDRFFRVDRSNFVINNQLQGSVRFALGNILESLPFGEETRYDVVFCRNLLIYFDERAKKMAANLIRNCLVDGGLLFVGHSETIWMSAQEGFSIVPEPHTFALLRTNRPIVPPPRPFLRPAPPSAAPKKSPVKPAVVSRVRATVSEKKTPALPVDELLIRARALANEGKVHEASEMTQRAIEERGPSAGALFLLGLLLATSGRVNEADVLLEKAIYLDPLNEEALTYSALIKEQTGQLAAAERLRERALRAHERSLGERHG